MLNTAMLRIVFTKIMKNNDWPLQEKNFKDLVQKVQEGILMVSGDGDLIYVNPYAIKMLGYKKNEIIKKNAWDVIYPNEVQKIKNIYNRRIEGKSAPRRYETILKKKDKSKLYVEFNVILTSWENKKVSLVVFRDISQQKEAEKKAKKTTKFPQENPFPVMEVAKDGVVLYANSVSKPILKKWKTKMGSPLPEEWIKKIKKIIKNKKSEDFEIEAGKSTFALTFSPVDKEKINIYGANITKSKNTEKTLKNTLKKLSSYIKNMPLGYIEWDKNLNIIDWNPTAEKIFKYKKTEIINKNSYNLLFPEKNKDYAYNFFNAIVENKKSNSFTVDCINKADKNILCQWFNTPLIENNKVIGITSIVRDITEHKQKEEQLKVLSSAIKQTDEGVVIVDIDNNVLFANQSFLDMHGYQSKEIINKHVDIFYPPMNTKDIRRVNKLIMKNGHFYEEAIAKHKNGKFFPISLNITLFYNEIGTPVGKIATIRDITKEKKAKEERKESALKIKKSKQQWEKTVNSLPHVILLVNKNGEILQANNVPEKWNLVKKKNIKRMKVENVLCPKGKCDCNAKKIWLQKWEKLKKGEIIDFKIDHPYLKKTLYLQAQPIADHKKLAKDDDFAVVAIYDITKEEMANKKIFDLYKHLGLINRRISIITDLNKDGLTKDEKEILHKIIKSAKDISQADACLLYKYNKQDHQLSFLMSSRKVVNPKQFELIKTVKIDDYPSLNELFTKKQRIQGLSKDYKIAKLDLENKAKAFVLFPIMQKSEIVGVLFLGFKNKDQITTQDLSFYNLFVNQISFLLDMRLN